MTDVNQLWALAVAQADGLTPTPTLASCRRDPCRGPGQVPLDFAINYSEPISLARHARYARLRLDRQLGILVVGGPDDTVTVTMPSGQERVFQPDSRPGGGYFDQQGDTGILTAETGGGFTLLESDGQVETFNANHTLNSIQDTNGNRVTAVYTGGQLTGLEASHGDPASNSVVASLAIAYNSSGLIVSVTSSDGRAVDFTYDSGKHLTSVKTFDGEVTSYTYASGSNLATQNAVTTIQYADGSQANFSYDSSGRLASESQTGGADPITYSYNVGEVTLTDAAGDAKQYFYGQNGEVVKAIDALGNVSFATYDSSSDLTSITGPTGLTQKYAYDAQGNLISSTDPLGQTTSYTYSGVDNRLTGVTNPQGDTTSVTITATGNVASVLAPDDSVQTLTYDAMGDPLSLTNANGQATGYTYNAAGQITGVTLSGG